MSSKPRNFVEAFKRVAEPILEQHPELRVSWESHPKDGGYTMRLPKLAPTGFDMGVEVQTYGLYPFAGGWRGMPWDIATPDTNVVAMSGYALGLIRALLSTDMRLKVRSAGRRPYKWCLEVATPTGWRVYEEHGSLLFRFFSARSDQYFHNDQLPPRGFAAGTSTLNPFETVWI